MFKINEEKSHIGGQAVIEGVMIRNKDVYSIAVRKQDGQIEIIKKDIGGLAQKFRFFRYPFIRGIVALIENLVLGIKSLMYSAEIAMPEDEKRKKDKKSSNSNILIFFAMIPAFILGIVLFVILPNISTHFIGIVEKDNPFIFNIIAGIIRLSVFLLYIVFISFMKDIKRVFQYHGAEHKSVFCYEANKPLVLHEAKKFKTMHPRCGTSFLFFVFFITILIFPIVTVSVKLIYINYVNLHIVYRKIIMILLHLIIALPIIASLSYEILRLSDKLKNNYFIKIIVSPGILLQKITTKEPDEKQLEVALEAVKSVL